MNILSNTNGKSLATIQDIAYELLEKEFHTNCTTKAKESTIILLGSKGVGKTTIIHKFLHSSDEGVSPTLAVEYNYCRRSLASNLLQQQQKLNFWELDSLEDGQEELLQLPFQIHGVKNLNVIIVIDLSQPDILLKDIEMTLTNLQNAYFRYLATDTKGSSTDIVALPLPIVIVGGKYDVFLNFDNALKEHICHHLLAIADGIGIGLLFYSKDMERLVKALRNTISHLGFGSPTNPLSVQQNDYNDALLLWFEDNTRDCSRVLRQSESILKSNKFSFNSIKESYNNKLLEIYKTNVTNSVMSCDKAEQPMLNNPSKNPNFSEETIDELLSQKLQQLTPNT